MWWCRVCVAMVWSRWGWVEYLYVLCILYMFWDIYHLLIGVLLNRTCYIGINLRVWDRSRLGFLPSRDRDRLENKYLRGGGRGERIYMPASRASCAWWII